MRSFHMTMHVREQTLLEQLLNHCIWEAQLNFSILRVDLYTVINLSSVL